VDECAIQFYGRKKDTYKLRHKPAGEGFILYALCSHGGLIHDFALSSSKEGIEEVERPIKVRIPARSTRYTKKGQRSMEATYVKLAPQKAVVYLICERVTADWRHKSFACYCDNLFVDINIA
jgi:hypothetical protein